MAEMFDGGRLGARIHSSREKELTGLGIVGGSSRCICAAMLHSIYDLHGFDDFRSIYDTSIGC